MDAAAAAAQEPPSLNDTEGEEIKEPASDQAGNTECMALTGTAPGKGRRLNVALRGSGP